MTVTFINHCIKMYDALNERAIDKTLESGAEARVFAGSYTEVWQSTGIAQTYYSPVRKALERHEAILVLQRGGRNVDTVIVLKGLPETWDIDGWRDNSDLTRSTSIARLSVEVSEVKKALGGLDVTSALVEVEKRLVALEEAVVLLQDHIKSESN